MKIGDVVRLRSGGPLMVVDAVYPTEDEVDSVHVAWSVEAKGDVTLRYARFPDAVFDIVKAA